MTKFQTGCIGRVSLMNLYIALRKDTDIAWHVEDIGLWSSNINTWERSSYRSFSAWTTTSSRSASSPMTVATGLRRVLWRWTAEKEERYRLRTGPKPLALEYLESLDGNLGVQGDRVIERVILED
jgi:hypothetical protein